MNRDTRASVIVALREIYDGAWTRHVGTDGGQTLSWEGKIGLIAGCNPAIDSHHVVMGSMGKRFVLFRVATTDEDDRAQVRRALARTGDRAMRTALQDAVGRVLDHSDIGSQRHSPDAVTSSWLVDLSTLAVRCRSAVERDGYTREIELIPGHEMPARLGLVLWRILRALRAIGVTDVEACELVVKIALDSMPWTRHLSVSCVPGRSSSRPALRDTTVGSTVAA